jgi:hypothetical protein
MIFKLSKLEGPDSLTQSLSGTQKYHARNIKYISIRLRKWGPQYSLERILFYGIRYDDFILRKQKGVTQI